MSTSARGAHREPSRLPLIAAMLVVAAAATASRARESAPAVTIVGATVIDPRQATATPGMTLVVAGARIVATGPDGAVTIPEGAQRIDGRGAFVMPGLWDMHVHLSLATASALPVLVANGVLGVRDMGGSLDEIDRWRTRIADGHLVGPLIVRAGPTVNGAQNAPHHLVVTTGDEARGAVRALAKAGVDFIKIHNALSREAYMSAVDEARRVGIRVAGHVPKSISPTEASDAGQASFEHTETIFEGTFQASVARERLLEAMATWKETDAPGLFARLVANHTAFTPTLVAYRASIGLRDTRQPDPRDAYLPAKVRDQEDEYRKMATPEIVAGRTRVLAEFKDLVGRMHRTGVRLLAGTDLAGPGLYPGFSLHDELALLVEAGLTPAAALAAATTDATAFLGMGSERGAEGVVEAGRPASFVVLEANPLADIRNVGKIRAVVTGGRYLDRAVLDALLAEGKRLASQ